MRIFVTVALMAASSLATVGVMRLTGLGEAGPGVTHGTRVDAPPASAGSTPPVAAAPVAAPPVAAPPVAAAPPTNLPPASDVTVPGDAIVGRHGDANGPAGQNPPQAIDNDAATKFFCIGENKGYAAPMNSTTGFTVTPGRGATVVSGLALTAGDDGPERDPASYLLEGSNDGTTFVVIAKGDVPVFPHRGARQVFEFSNGLPYTTYRLAFPTLANASTAIAMQIAEVELIGR